LLALFRGRWADNIYASRSTDRVRGQRSRLRCRAAAPLREAAHTLRLSGKTQSPGHFPMKTTGQISAKINTALAERSAQLRRQ
jgi:hypothetical protein